MGASYNSGGQPGQGGGKSGNPAQNLFGGIANRLGNVVAPALDNMAPGLSAGIGQELGNVMAPGMGLPMPGQPGGKGGPPMGSQQPITQGTGQLPPGFGAPSPIDRSQINPGANIGFGMPPMPMPQPGQGGGGMDRDGNPISGGPLDNFHTSGAQPMPQPAPMPAAQPLQFLDANGLPTSSHGGGKSNMNINPFNPADPRSDAYVGGPPMPAPIPTPQPVNRYAPPMAPGVRPQPVPRPGIPVQQARTVAPRPAPPPMRAPQPVQQPAAYRPQPMNQYTRTRAPRIR